MKIGAYQFAVSGEVEKNLEKIMEAISQASKNHVKLLVFPECALTGYPPYDIEKASEIEPDQVNRALEKIRLSAVQNDMHIILGTITAKDGKNYNSAVMISPNKPSIFYHKRALWGWDQENFSTCEKDGIFEIDGLKIGVRICFEVRFPEYFRELYRKHTDLNVILFYDVSVFDDFERYELIKSHIRTRAVENVCYTLSVNTIKPYQTAPTALYDKSGRTLGELERNQEKLFLYDLDTEVPDFGEQGRIQISDLLQENIYGSYDNLPTQKCGL